MSRGTRNRDSELSDEEMAIVRAIVIRGVHQVVVRVLEIISRYAQYRLRELSDKGFVNKYNIDMDITKGQDQLEWRMVITVRVPQWFIDEMAERKADAIRLILKTRAGMRRAEMVAYRWPRDELEFRLEQLEERLAQEVRSELESQLGLASSGGPGGGRGAAVEEVPVPRAEIVDETADLGRDEPWVEGGARRRDVKVSFEYVGM